MAKQVVGSMSDWSGVLKDFFRQVDDGSHTLESVRAFNEHRNPFEVAPCMPNWADEVAAQARRKLKRFFGRHVRVNPVPASWAPEFLENAAKYNMRPVYFIDLVLSEDLSLKNYVKPERWLYQKIREGKVSMDAITLKKRWCLADFSIGVDYTDGSQVFPNDPWAPIIEKLRRELKVVGKYDNTPWGSRFAITPQEWDDVVLAHMASALQVTRAKISLESAGKFNFIGNVYDPNRGKFNMLEWFRDPFGDSCRLCGGFRGSGGLASVDYVGSSGSRHGRIAGRPLVSFI